MNRRGPIVAGVGALVLAALVLFFLVMPRVSDVHKTQNELKQAQQEESTLRVHLEQLRQARRDAVQVRKQLAHLQTKVPPTADLPSLYRLLKSAADRSAVDFMSWAPAAPALAPTGGVSVIPTQITAGGSFFAVDEFMFRLETLPRAIKVTQINVSSGGEQTELQVQLSAEVYTTDLSTGPGSDPGPSTGGSVPVPTPTAGA